MLICVTNRKLCKDDFLERIRQLAAGKPQAIVLREKDLAAAAYQKLAVEVDKICKQNQVALVINQNIAVAHKLKQQNIQLSMDNLRRYQEEIKKFKQIGAAVHSVAEAKEAEGLGATYLVAGHIFATDCKKGVAPRGLAFLKAVCEATTIPVLAIGGITRENFASVLQSGAVGACIMSEAMTCQKPAALADDYKKIIRTTCIDNAVFQC
jgi:thiamine-phosphate pyrophosphorylase